MSGRLNEAYSVDPGEDMPNALGLRWRANEHQTENPRNHYQDDVGLQMEKLEENNVEDNTEEKIDKLTDEEEISDPIYNAKSLQGTNVPSRILLFIRGRFEEFTNKNKSSINLILKICLGALIIIYFGFVVKFWFDQGMPSPNWCNGSGMLLLLVIFTSWCVLYYNIIKPTLSDGIFQKYIRKELQLKIYKVMSVVVKVLVGLLITSIFIFVIYDSYTYWRRLLSFAGIFVFIFCGFIFSKHPAHIPWRAVIVGTLVQYTVGLLAIRWQIGRAMFVCLGNTAKTFLEFAYVGAEMVFGTEIVVTQGVFAFKSLSVIFFMGMIVQMLFYLGWMQVFCLKLGWFVQKLMGTTVCESVNAVSSVFLGLSEALFLYKPYIKDLTTSEIHAVMVGGLSTVAGTLFAAYAALGANPAHIITASAMTAPSALMFAKILFPETEVSKTDADNFQDYKSEDKSLVDAATQGALAGVNIVQSIIAGVVAAVSLVAFANSLVSWFLSQVGIMDTNLETLVSYILIPVVWIMGVKPENCLDVARLIGVKTIVNEFVGYSDLGKLKATGVLSARSEAIATYAMCSFANPGSVAIISANLLSLCPEQRENIIKVSLRAFVGGVTTSFITACVAGSLMPEEGYPDLENYSSNLTLHTS